MGAPGEIYERGEAFRFGAEDSSSQRRQRIVAPPSVGTCGGFGLLDQALVLEPLDGRVESAGLERNGTRRAMLDILDYAVPVPRLRL